MVKPKVRYQRSETYHKNTKEMFLEMNEIAGKRKSGPASSCIKDKDGKLLIEKNEVLNRWAEYIEDLFQDDRQDKPHIEKPIEGAPILKDEVRKAIKIMNHGRAAGPDGITIEALIALGEWGISQITDLLNIIYDNGEIPEEMCKNDDLERLALTGRVQGKRDRGRQIVTFLHSLNQGVTQGTRSKTEFLRFADDREEWRLMTADVCNRPGT
ncbi:TIR-NBS-LRR type disease resistance protein [Elysia marginata]|uniref:TIR-NBS-LRR type disease resistance protein n=1 Tax=Elysia marginata TaxID=1093978 RepID=A0AAV4K3Q1_9GAST|nr:TIR-NBS-LRR type disease resistance protein [Elysia marginata]